MAKKLAMYDELGYQLIYDELRELYLSSFRWAGLPDEINERFFEMELFQSGRVAFMRDEVTGGHAVTRVTDNGPLNLYGEATKLRCIGGGAGQYQKVRFLDDPDPTQAAVVVYNNFTRTPPHQRLMAYALRIHHIENTIDINVNAQKTPYVLVGNRKLQATLKRIYTQLAAFEPAIFADDSIDLSNIKVFQTVAPYVVDKLEDQKRKLWNEALSYIGIDNNSSEKNERLLHDEILVSNGLAIANRNARLQCRESAAEKINRIFGLAVSVEFNNPSFYNDPYTARAVDVDESGVPGDE